MCPLKISLFSGHKCWAKMQSKRTQHFRILRPIQTHPPHVNEVRRVVQATTEQLHYARRARFYTLRQHETYKHLTRCKVAVNMFGIDCVCVWYVCAMWVSHRSHTTLHAWQTHSPWSRPDSRRCLLGLSSVHNTHGVELNATWVDPHDKQIQINREFNLIRQKVPWQPCKVYYRMYHYTMQPN